MGTYARRSAVLAASTILASAFAAGAQAQTVGIYGGGSSASAQDYAGPAVANNANPTAPSEEATFDSANPQFGFQYFSASSGRGQSAFAADNPALLQYTGGTPLPPVLHYAASDSFLSGANGTTVNDFTYTTVNGIPGITATYPLRSTQDGALIQIPLLGVGIAIPALSGNSLIKKNGALKLTDNDLCGIFSGKITDYAGIQKPITGLSGPITVYYRGDSSGNTFLLTSHFKSVCNSSNSQFPDLAAAPTSTFAALFTGGTVPASFIAETGTAAVATALAGTVTTSGGTTVGQPGNPSGIGYVTPDFTDISPLGASNTTAASNPPGGFINTRALFAASVNGITPTAVNIASGLAHGGAGSVHTKPPTGGAVANPLNWVPSVPVTTAGYPIVGYSSWLLAQCYSSSNVASGLVSFLTQHFQSNPAYTATIKRNGFGVVATAFRTAILNTFLSSSSKLGIAAAGTAGACASVPGR